MDAFCAREARVGKLLHQGCTRSMTICKPCASGLTTRALADQVAGLRRRVAGLRDARADHHCTEARELHLRRHCHRVVERERSRQLRLALDDRQRHARALGSAGEDEQRVVGPDARGQIGADGDFAAERSHPRRAWRRWPRRPCRRSRARSASAMLLPTERASGDSAGTSAEQPLPVAARRCVVLGFEGHGAGQRERLDMLRVGVERALDHARRFAGELAALRHREHVGEVGEQAPHCRATVRWRVAAPWPRRGAGRARRTSGRASSSLRASSGCAFSRSASAATIFCTWSGLVLCWATMAADDVAACGSPSQR